MTTKKNNQPPKDLELNLKLVSDLFRHRFTNLRRVKNDISWWPNSGSITRVLKPLSIAIATDNSDENKQYDSAHSVISKGLFEANYVKIQNPEEEDFDLFDEFHGDFKLIGTEQGYFASENSTWALLIDRRSWSQLKEDYRNTISEEHLVFLESGHRLIRLEVANNIGMNKLTELEYMNRYPKSPVSFLMAHFQDDDQNSFSTSDIDGKYYSDWLDISKLEPDEDPKKVYLRANNLSTERNRWSSIWVSKENHSELRITISKTEEWYFSLERLIPKVHVEDSFGKLHFPHKYRLHISKDFVNPKTNEDEFESRVVTIFDQELGLIPEAFRDYFGNLNSEDKTAFTYEHLNDVVRSLFAASGTLSSINEPGWTCPIHVRRWIGPLTVVSGDTVVEMINDVDSELSGYVADYLNKRMWLDI